VKLHAARGLQSISLSGSAPRYTANISSKTTLDDDLRATQKSCFFRILKLKPRIRALLLFVSHKSTKEAVSMANADSCKKQQRLLRETCLGKSNARLFFGLPMALVSGASNS